MPQMVFKQEYLKDTFFLHKALNFNFQDYISFKNLFSKKMLGVPRHFQLNYI